VPQENLRLFVIATRLTTMPTFLMLIALCLFGSCSSKYADFFPYYDDGSIKPTLVLLPVEIETDMPLTWDVAKELTNGLYRELMERGKVFMPSSEWLQKVQSCSAQDWHHMQDLQVFRAFLPAHFVACLEIVNYQELPYQRGAFTPLYPAALLPDEACVISIQVHLKIVDIRNDKVKLVRQELIQSNHVALKNAIQKSLELRKVGQFAASPLACIHARLLLDLTCKIENTCLLNRK
jgi:hypothetical protein